MANGPLGNESPLDYILKTGGKMYGQPIGLSTWIYLGETHDIVNNFEVERDTIPDTEGCTPGVAASYITATTLTLNWSSYSYTPENIAMAFAGEITPGIAAQTDVSVTTSAVVPGEYTDLGYTILTDLVVMDDQDAITYVEGVDYTINMKAGLLGIIMDAGISEGDELHITLSTDEGKDSVQYLKGTTTQMALKFVGCASSGKSNMVEFYKAEVTASGDVGIKSSDVQSIAFTGDCLADPSKAGGSISEYATMTFLE
jgi:hypothetical protein